MVQNSDKELDGYDEDKNGNVVEKEKVVSTK